MSFSAFIKPDGLPGRMIYSKYVIHCTPKHPKTSAGDEIFTYNINSDITVPKFYSVGATKHPEERSLTCEFRGHLSQLTGRGLHRFEGKIGGGRIRIVTSKGVMFQGKIVGGPTSEQSFTGTGTWHRYKNERDPKA